MNLEDSTLLHKFSQPCICSNSCLQEDLVVEDASANRDCAVQQENIFQKSNSNLTSYHPFPLCSVNLITCSSNSGKTRFLTEVVEKRDRFFQFSKQLRRVVYVNGNQRDIDFDNPWENKTASGQKTDLEVVCYSLQDFSEVSTVCEPHDLVIVDDLLAVTDPILYLVKYGAHHHNLIVFLVTQSCLSSPLYQLVNCVHNLVLLFGNSATSKLAQHLVQSFFLCSDTKKYLRDIFAVAEKRQHIVLLKLNAVASYHLHSKILALSGVQNLFSADASSASCLVYPELAQVETFMENMADIEAEMPDDFANAAEGSSLLDGTFLLVPAHRVRRIVSPADLGKVSAPVDCVKEKESQWNEMVDFLESEIEQAFPFKRWGAAKNLTRELLRCSQLCISSDYRTVFVKDRNKLAFSIIDFLNCATRKAGPGETSEKVALYRPLVQLLLRHNVPHSFVVNKLLLPPHHLPRQRNHKRRGQN